MCLASFGIYERDEWAPCTWYDFSIAAQLVPKVHSNFPLIIIIIIRISLSSLKIVYHDLDHIIRGFGFVSKMEKKDSFRGFV